MAEGKPEKSEKQGAISALSAGRGALDSFGIAIFFVVVFEVVLLYFMNFMMVRNISDIDKEIQDFKQKLASPEYRDVNTKVSEVLAGEEALKTALDNKIIWSRLYSQLNAVTPKNIRVKSLAIDEKAAAKIQGLTNSLSSLAKAMVTYEKGGATVVTPLSKIELQNHSFVEEDNQKFVSWSLSAKVNLDLMGINDKGQGCRYFYEQNCQLKKE